MLLIQSDVISIPITEMLEVIIQHYQIQGCAATLRIVAQKLSVHTPDSRQYSWNYLHQIRNRKIKFSKKITKLIESEYKKLINNTQIEFEERVVITPVGLITETPIINVRPKKCLACQRSFIPASPNQRYCVENCRKKRKNNELI